MNTDRHIFSSQTADLGARYGRALVAFLKHPSRRNRMAMRDAEIFFRASYADDLRAAVQA